MSSYGGALNKPSRTASTIRDKTPEISRFFGIIITMFFEDHNPPHFHAKYGDHSAVIRTKDFAVMEGGLPPRTLGLVMEWAEIHKDELLKDWELAIQNKPLLPIAPLE